jgi:glycosyltransferase involved in cell wall biosynthesis
MRKTISAVLITHNEAENLPDCLASLQDWVDEIVVVDNHSSDDTVRIAQQHGAKVLQTPDWPGFGLQKNRALDLATCDWVLSIDADERVTPELMAEIQSILATEPMLKAYEIPRLSWYCGKFIRHAGWRPDFVLRLFERDSARFSDDLVHERVVPTGNVGQLKHALLHYSYRNFSQVLHKVNAYSSASAQQAFASGKRSSVAGALGHGAWAFFRTYVLRAGFLDGSHGLALSISNAQTSYYKYLKLWQMAQDLDKH